MCVEPRGHRAPLLRSELGSQSPQPCGGTAEARSCEGRISWGPASTSYRVSGSRIVETLPAQRGWFRARSRDYRDRPLSACGQYPDIHEQESAEPTRLSIDPTSVPRASAWSLQRETRRRRDKRRFAPIGKMVTRARFERAFPSPLRARRTRAEGLILVAPSSVALAASRPLPSPALLRSWPLASDALCHARAPRAFSARRAPGATRGALRR